MNARKTGVAFHGRRGHAEHFGDVFDFKPCEEAQFEYLAGATVERVERAERFIDRDDLFGIGLDRDIEAVDGIERGDLAAAAFFRESGAGVVDEHLSHRGRGNREEVTAIAEALLALPEQFEERLIDHRTGGQGEATIAMAHGRTREPLHFGMDIGHQFAVGAIGGIQPIGQLRRVIGIGRSHGGKRSARVAMAGYAGP